MVVEMHVNSPVHHNDQNGKSKSATGFTNNNNLYKEQLAVIKTNFLNPNEVTFCDVSDEDVSITSDNSRKTSRRKRLLSTDTDADSIVSSVHPTKKKPNIPDGGYGWMIVLSSVVISLIADGISFSYGLLFSEHLAYFKESKTKTAWVGSLFMAVPLLSGPIMSNLVDNYGCRKMTFIGGLLTGTGFVLASFANSIEELYLTMGVIAGLGLGLNYVTAVVAIAFWFDKKRTFATGIGASGTGIGTFIYAPMTTWLIDAYGWRGATLMIAGTCFNLCVCGMVMRDPEWMIEENALESRSQSIQTFSNSSVCLDEIKKLLETGAHNEDVLDTLVTNVNTEANQQMMLDHGNEQVKRYQSELMLPTYIEQKDEFKLSVGVPHGSRRSLRPADVVKSPEILSIEHFIPSNKSASQVLSSDCETPKKRNLASAETLNASEKNSSKLAQSRNSISSRSYEELNRRFSLDESSMFRPDRQGSMVMENHYKGISLDAIDEGDRRSSPPNANGAVIIPMGQSGPKPKIRRRNTEKANFMRQSSLKTSHYLKNMRIHRNSIHYRGAMLNTHRYRLRASSCPNIYRNSMTTIARESDEKWYDSFVEMTKSVFDFSLFKQLRFCIFNLSTLLVFIWFIVPYFYSKEYMSYYNYTDDESARLLSVIGVAQTIGMIFLGWAGDQPWLNVTKVYAGCLAVCGVSVILMPIFITQYYILLTLGVIFGLTFASSFSFIPIILVHLVDLDDFTCAYGLVLLVQGCGNLVGPPLAALIYDVFGSWDETFYAAGFFLIIAGTLAFATGDLVDEDDETDDDDDDDLSSNP